MHELLDAAAMTEGDESPPEDPCSDRPSSSSTPCQTASELQILMDHRTRMSRTRRMNFYLDLHETNLSLDKLDANAKKPFQVVGVETENGHAVGEDSEYKVGPRTHCLFFSKNYRMSFVVDFSPSCFVVDGEGDLLYANMIPSIAKMLRELVRPFKFSNSSNMHKAVVYASLFAYAPYIKFDKSPLLIYGYCVTENTLEDFLNIARQKTNDFMDALLDFMEPYNIHKAQLMKEHNEEQLRLLRLPNEPYPVQLPQESRRDTVDVKYLREAEFQRRALENVDRVKKPTNAEQSKILREITQAEAAGDFQRAAELRESMATITKARESCLSDPYMFQQRRTDVQNQEMADMRSPEEIAKADADAKSARADLDKYINGVQRTVRPFDASEFEEIPIDFRLWQIIRYAMFGLYGGPEISQPSIVVVTDGVLYIPNQKVVQSIALNLRTNCIPLSFIQIDANPPGPCAGLIASDCLLSFLAGVSCGHHFRHKPLLQFQAPDDSLNEYQKRMLSWSCQKTYYSMEASQGCFPRADDRSRRVTTKLSTNFFLLFHTRIREGYKLLQLNTFHRAGRAYILATFRLPWTVDCQIDYEMTALFEDRFERVQTIDRKVTVETNYPVVARISDPQDSAYTAGLYLSESENFALKVISFSVVPAHYEFERLPLERYQGLFGFTKKSRPFPSLLIKEAENSKLLAYWQPLVLADSAALHRCCHSVTLRFTAQYLSHMHAESEFVFDHDWHSDSTWFPARNLVQESVLAYLAETMSFCLVARYCYVHIVREEEQEPEFCYLVKVFFDTCLLTVTVVFIGDCSLEKRNRIIKNLKMGLISYEPIKDMLTPMATGVDAKMIRYHEYPNTWGDLQPLTFPPPKELWLTREKLHQRFIARLLIPGRNIFKVEKFIDDDYFGVVANELMNLLIRRRLLEGFRVAYCENGIFTLVREHHSEQGLIPPVVEQFIVYPASKKPLELKGQQVQTLREQLAAVGRLVAVPGTGEEPPSIIIRTEKSPKPEENTEGVSQEEVPKTPQQLKLERRLRRAERRRQKMELKMAEKEARRAERRAAKEAEREARRIAAGKPPRKSRVTESEPVPAESKNEQTEASGDIAVAASEQQPAPEGTTAPEVPEVYLDEGCFIVTEHWTEPGIYRDVNISNSHRKQQLEQDRFMMSAVMTFRSMQTELNNPPGISTAFMGKEPYATHVNDCAPINMAPNVDYHAHLYDIVKMCRCGERMLVLLPSLEYGADPQRNDRLSRLLEAFNHELRNFMPQCFEFEDTDDVWKTLTVGLEGALKERDSGDLDSSVYGYDSDSECVFEDDSPGTGFSSPATTVTQDTNVQLTNQMTKMNMDALTKHVLSGFGNRNLCGSGDVLNKLDGPGAGCVVSPSSSGTHATTSSNANTAPDSPNKLDSPKPVLSEQRSTPSLPEEDEDDEEFYPKAKKTTTTPPVLAESTLPVEPMKKALSDRPESKKSKKRSKRRAKDELANSSMSLNSIGRASERSYRHARVHSITDVDKEMPLSFNLYYMQRDSTTVIVVLVPVKLEGVLQITGDREPKVPVLAFMVEEERLLYIFRHTTTIPTNFRRTTVENYCAPSALAHLNWQVSTKLSESEREAHSPGGFSFDQQDGREGGISDLRDLCTTVIYDRLFSRAYALATYLCLGKSVHVPPLVLKEAVEDHCQQTSVDLGSVRDVLRVTCTHLSSYLQSRRVSRYRRHQMPNISSTSSSESEIELQQVADPLVNPFCYSEVENDEICRLEQAEFEAAFENVLRQHNFFRVPAFADYYFYWPDGDNTIKLFNSGGIWNEHLESTVFPLEDKSSHDSAVTLLSEHGDSHPDASDSSMDEGDNVYDQQPLFLQFYVNVRRPDNDVDSFSVNHIPNCLKTVVHKCTRNFVTEDLVLDDLNVSIEMYVLTVPPLNYLNFIDDHLEDRSCDRLRRTTEETVKWINRSSSQVDTNLPAKEEEIVKKLELGIRHMLETEKILILSRYFDSQKSYKNICRVVAFVEQESGQCGEHSRVLTAQSDMMFVVNQNEGLRRLIARLEGARFSYCKIRCVRDEKAVVNPTIVFYCCSVENMEEFRTEHKDVSDAIKFDFKPKRRPRTSRTTEDGGTDEDSVATGERTESSTLIHRRSEADEEGEVEEAVVAAAHATNGTDKLDEKVKRKQIVHDFWLLAKLEPDPMRVTSFFFQRLNGVHDCLFKRFTDLLVEEMKLVNQELLLEDLAAKGICNPFLIEMPLPLLGREVREETPAFPPFASQFIVQPDSLVSTNGSASSTSASPLPEDEDRIADEPFPYHYSFGYFFCPMVHRHWFPISTGTRPALSTKSAIAALREELKHHRIRNLRNVYYFREDDGNIGYMYLFSSVEAANAVIKEKSDDWQQELEANMTNHVLLAIFGIRTPGTQFLLELVQNLEQRLDTQILEELQQAVYKDTTLPLGPAQVAFIQRDPALPSARKVYSLPPTADDFLASVFMYLLQHLHARYINPRFAQPHEPHGHFRPFPHDGAHALEETHHGTFFLISKPKRDAKDGAALACLEVRIVDRTGIIVRENAFTPGKLNGNSFSRLYPGISGLERMQRTARFLELTKSVQLESLEKQAGCVNANYFVQFFVWEHGCIGMNELETRLRILCQQALADLVVEFGVLAQSFLNPPDAPEETNSRPANLTRQNAVELQQRAQLRKRGSTQTSDISGSVGTAPPSASLSMSTSTHSPLLPPATPAVPVSPVMLPPTILAVDSPSMFMPMLQSPRHGTIGNRFAFDGGQVMTNSWTDVALLGAHRVTLKLDPTSERPKLSPKVNQHATSVPPIPAGPMEYLRMDFIPATSMFFNYVEREAKSYPELCTSFQKHCFVLDCEQTAQTILKVVYAKMVEMFGGLNDSVVLLQAVQTESGRSMQTISDTTALLASAITHDRGHVTELSESYNEVEYALIVLNRTQMRQMIDQSACATNTPAPELLQLCKAPQDFHFLYPPSLCPFVPRRRFFYLLFRGESVSLFLYNVKKESVAVIRETIEKAVYWNNARSRLLREIGLHKMQITHLSTLRLAASPYEYQLLTWRDPETLIAYDYPPNQIRTSDIARMPQKFSHMFLKPYRFADPAFVLKQNAPTAFEDQTAQVLSMREEIKETLNDVQMFQEVHNQFLMAKAKPVTLSEDVLMRLLNRCEEVHYVQTPLLLFPEWRKKVAAIRSAGKDFGSIERRKSSAPHKSQSNRSVLEPKMKPRSKTVTESMLPSLIRNSVQEDPTVQKVQVLLAEQYLQYLEEFLRVRRIQVNSIVPDAYSLEFSNAPAAGPVIWLQQALKGGFIFLQLSFIEPYFCLRVLTWSRGQLFENQPIADLQEFVRAKNHVVALCHLHSFTYDFHLRLMATYMLGTQPSAQTFFSSGYNTNGFLVDFLQYYGCRPPSARNCVFEENCLLNDLKVPGYRIWEKFLDKESVYGWKVVRIKHLDKESKDEHMFVSTVEKNIFKQDYWIIRVVTNVAKGTNNKEHRLCMRYYVIMVNKDERNPMMQTLMCENGGVPEGEFKELNPRPQESDEDDDLSVDNDLDFRYDSDARQSSGSNSDRSQRQLARIRSRQSQSVASLFSGNDEVPDVLADLEASVFLNSPHPSPIPHTLVETSSITPRPHLEHFDVTELRNRLTTTMVEREPPRGHRKTASIGSEARNLQGAIPSEQVTYVHYVNKFQQALQQELETFARASKEELESLVQKADRQCHVEMLWYKLLSDESINQRKKEMSVLTQIGNRLEGNQDAAQVLKQITSTDLSKEEWRVFLDVIKVVNMEEEEPRLRDTLANYPWQMLFRFLVLHFEGEKRCRFFCFDDSKNLVITNPNCLDSATLLRFADSRMQLCMLFKEHDFGGSQAHLFGRNAIHKQFEEIMHCLASFMWTDLLTQRPPKF